MTGDAEPRTAPDFFWFQLFLEQGPPTGEDWQAQLRGRAEELVTYRPHVKCAAFLAFCSVLMVAPAIAEGASPVVGVVAVAVTLWAALHRRTETLGDRARRAAARNLDRKQEAELDFQMAANEARTRGLKRRPSRSELSAKLARIDRESEERLRLLLRVLAQPAGAARPLPVRSAYSADVARQTLETQRQIAREDAARGRRPQ